MPGGLDDIGLEPPSGSRDLAAWMEACLGGRWHMFDPRANAPREGRVLTAFGRDAVDVSLTHAFGSNRPGAFRVWTDEVPAGSPAVAK